jgi:hypothetical protein
MPEKLKKARFNGYKSNNYHSNNNNNHSVDYSGANSFSPFSPNQYVSNFGQQNTMI